MEPAQNNNSFFFISLLLVALVGSLLFIFKDKLFNLAGVQVSKTNLLSSSGPEMHSSGNVNLTFSPQSLSLKVGETKDVDLMIDTGVEKVSIAELLLTLDSNVFEVTNLKPGVFMSDGSELGKKIEAGQVSYSLGTLSAQSGKGSFVKVSIKGKARGTGMLAVSTETKVRAIKKTINVLGQAGELQVKVN